VARDPAFVTVDPNGNEIRLTDPKGQIITFDYDELNRLKSKVYGLTAADLALFTRTHRIDYVYNPSDDVERIDETKSSGTDPPAVVSNIKTYDDLNRLETETDAWGRRLTYDYDPAGNRILLIDPDGKRTVYACDELNRLENPHPRRPAGRQLRVLPRRPEEDRHQS
jgi:YD repeat-containing protein